MGGIAAKEKQVPGRKIVIWISPGWPLLSGPRMDLSGKDQQRLFGSIVSMSTALRQARVTVYSIDPLGMADAGSLRMTYYENFLKPAKTYRQVEIGDLGLQVLARQTGGLALNSSNDLTNLIDRCVADADTFYRVTVPMAPAEQPNEFHEIDVKVETPGLTARTRNGYYAQP
jgi:VWFA-related protein